MDEKFQERSEEYKKLFQEIVTGVSFTPSNVEKLLTYNLTDAGNAELFRDIAGDKFCYVPERGHWFKFNGVYWEQNDESAIIMMLNIHRRRIDLVNSNLVPISNHSDFRTKLIKFSLMGESSYKLKAALFIAQNMLTKKYSEFDKDPYLLCCKNGVINLRTGQFRKTKSEDYLSKCTYITYDANADCPRWYKFLEEIFCNDDEMVIFNQKAVGYTLTGKTSAQCIFILHGGGQNGKSTYLDVISKLLGDFAHSASMNMFKEQRYENNIPNDVAALCGKRFVKAIESKEGARLNEERVKMLTGDGCIPARFLHHEWFNFDPTHKIWLAVNHLPVIKGTDEAIWRRVKRLPFEAQFPEGKRDENLRDKLFNELPGILNWAITGCILWQDEGLTMAQKVKAATQAYRDESDFVGKFLEECTIQKQDTKTKAGDLYKAYCEWSEILGEKPIKQKAFGLRITEKGFIKKTITGYPYYFGLGLISH